MALGTLLSDRLVSWGLILGLVGVVGGCGTDKEGTGPGNEGGEDVSEVDDADTGDDGPDEEDNIIGDPIGEPVPIDHTTAQQTIEANLIRHIDGLESALEFLESSDAVNNLVDTLFGDDDDEESEDEEELAAEPIDIDLSEFRDGMVEMMRDRIMVESTSAVAEDGLSIRYALSPEFFCAEDPEEDESAEDEAERMEDQEACAERLATNPVEISVMSDGEGDMNLSLLAGDEAVESARLQIHQDMMSIVTDLANLTPLFEVFIDPSDFEMPRSMVGTLGAEVREAGALAYDARFAALDAISVVPDDDQEPVSLQMPEAKDPGHVSIDGKSMTLDGSLNIDALEASVPWQMIVDMFYDEEGHSEWICETDESGEEDCWEEWVDAPEPPEVDEAFIVKLPAVMGDLSYASDDDVFRFTDMGLGDGTTLVSVDADTIISLDLNPDDGRTLSLAVSGNEDQDVGLEFSPSVDVQLTFAWNKVSAAFEDLPNFLLDDTLGVQMDGSDAPRLDILRGEDTQFRVTSGQLTLWSAQMDEDVVIEEGECITGIDEDGMSEEELDALHDLFGTLIGDTCES